MFLAIGVARRSDNILCIVEIQISGARWNWEVDGNGYVGSGSGLVLAAFKFIFVRDGLAFHFWSFLVRGDLHVYGRSNGAVRRQCDAPGDIDVSDWGVRRNSGSNPCDALFTDISLDIHVQLPFLGTNDNGSHISCQVRLLEDLCWVACGQNLRNKLLKLVRNVHANFGRTLRNVFAPSDGDVGLGKL